MLSTGRTSRFPPGKRLGARLEEEEPLIHRTGSSSVCIEDDLREGCSNLGVSELLKTIGNVKEKNPYPRMLEVTWKVLV